MKFTADTSPTTRTVYLALHDGFWVVHERKADFGPEDAWIVTTPLPFPVSDEDDVSALLGLSTATEATKARAAWKAVLLLRDTEAERQRALKARL